MENNNPKAQRQKISKTVIFEQSQNVLSGLADGAPQHKMAGATVYTYKKHIGAANTPALYSDLLAGLLAGKNTVLQAPPGAGKSTLVISDLMPALARAGYVAFFAVPFAAQRDELASKVDTEHELLQVYTESQRIVSDATAQRPGIICTYDKLALAHERMQSTIAAMGGRFVLIVDETHLLPTHRGFRGRAVDSVEMLQQHPQCHAALHISATPDASVAQLFGMRTIVAQRETPAPVLLFVTKSQQGETRNDFARHILALHSAGHKVLAYANDTPTLQAAALHAQAVGADPAKIYIYTGQKSRKATPHGQYLAENELLPADAEIVLCTSVLRQAVSIRNEGFALVYAMLQGPDKNASELVQFAYRLRHNLETLEPIQCHIVAPAKFWGEHERVELAKGINLSEPGKRAKQLLYFAYNALPSFQSKKPRSSHDLPPVYIAGAEKIAPRMAYMYAKGTGLVPSKYGAIAQANTARYGLMRWPDFETDLRAALQPGSLQGIDYMPAPAMELSADVSDTLEALAADVYGLLLSDYKEHESKFFAHIGAESKNTATQRQAAKFEAPNADAVPPGLARCEQLEHETGLLYTRSYYAAAENLVALAASFPTEKPIGRAIAMHALEAQANETGADLGTLSEARKAVRWLRALLLWDALHKAIQSAKLSEAARAALAQSVADGSALGSYTQNVLHSLFAQLSDYVAPHYYEAKAAAARALGTAKAKAGAHKARDAKKARNAQMNLARDWAYSFASYTDLWDALQGQPGERTARQEFLATSDLSDAMAPIFKYCTDADTRPRGLAVGVQTKITAAPLAAIVWGRKSRAQAARMHEAIASELHFSVAKQFAELQQRVSSELAKPGATLQPDTAALMESYNALADGLNIATATLQAAADALAAEANEPDAQADAEAVERAKAEAPAPESPASQDSPKPARAGHAPADSWDALADVWEPDAPEPTPNEQIPF